MAANNSVMGHTRSYERALLVLEAIFGLGVVVAIIGAKYGTFPTITFVVCALALAFTAWVSLQMVTSVSDPTLQITGKVRDYHRERLEDEKRLLLQGIKDLESDYATAKMDEVEYQRLRRSAEARAIAIIHEIKATNEHWTFEAEKLVSARTGQPLPKGLKKAPSKTVEKTAAKKKAAPPTKFVTDQPAADARVFNEDEVVFSAKGEHLVCEACGHENDSDARYCAGCGRPRAQEQAA